MENQGYLAMTTHHQHTDMDMQTVILQSWPTQVSLTLLPPE